MFCVDIVKGHATRCPNNRDSRTQEYLCPEYTRGPEYPGQQVAIESDEAELARSTAVTAMNSAFLEVAALVQEKARTVGLMVEDSPDNALTRPHFLQARLEAASRILPARERTIRRVYPALRALEYELNQGLPSLRDTLAAARSPEDIASLSTCLAGIAEDYRLAHGYSQPYVTEVSLRADSFGLTTDVADDRKVV